MNLTRSVPAARQQGRFPAAGDRRRLSGVPIGWFMLCAGLLIPATPQLCAAAGDAGKSDSERPMRGDTTPGFSVVDEQVIRFMDLIGCQAGTITVTRDGSVLGSRGYGWKDAERQQATRPDTPMRIASCTKPMTAACVKLLIRRGTLAAERPVFPMMRDSLKLDDPVDSRVDEITVGQLLDHRGGFDRAQLFDPMFRTKLVEKHYSLTRPASAADIIRYMMSQSLQFPPGDRVAYSNFGYAVLGRVIEQTSGLTYFDFVNREIATPLRITDLHLSRSQLADRPVEEVWYPVPDSAFRIEVMDAHGGISTSTNSLCKFMTAYWLSGNQRKPGERQSWVFFGSLPGTTAMMIQQPDGTNCAALFNGRRNRHFQEDNRRLREWITAALAALPKR